MSFQNWFSEINYNKRKIIWSLVFLAVAILFYVASGDYLADHALNSVVSPDLILDNFGPYDLSLIFIWGFIIVVFLFFSYPLIFKINELYYSISIFSLLVIVRSVFIMFTHLKIPDDAINVVFPGIFQLLNFSNDLFFSGHVGVSFLGFLIFRKQNKYLGYVMLAFSFILGATVLLMHVHYSIDVFSAYFITYGIYRIGNKLVKRT